MKDEVDAAHRLLQLCLIKQVTFDDLQVLAWRDELVEARREVVEHRDSGALGEKCVDHVATDEAGAARHQGVLALPVHLRALVSTPRVTRSTAQERRLYFFFGRPRQALLNSAMVSMVRGFQTILRRIGGVTVGTWAPASSASLTS